MSAYLYNSRTLTSLRYYRRDNHNEAGTSAGYPFPTSLDHFYNFRLITCSPIYIHILHRFSVLCIDLRRHMHDSCATQRSDETPVIAQARNDKLEAKALPCKS